MSATLMLIVMQEAMDDDRFSSQGQPDALNTASALLNHWRAQGNPIVHIRHDSMDRSSFMGGVTLACKEISAHPGVTVGLDSYLGL